jgi:hypothetical protein
MTMSLEQIRDENGQLPAYAWPGGYPMYYLDKCGNALCPKCANREVDQSQEPVAHGINWEDADLYCDDCNARIESAYAEPESIG